MSEPSVAEQLRGMATTLRVTGEVLESDFRYLPWTALIFLQRECEQKGKSAKLGMEHLAVMLEELAKQAQEQKV